MINFVEESQKYGVQIDDKMLQKFDKYFEILVEWNLKFNLTTITSREEVFVKHFLDSVSICPFIPQNATVCDVGSGAGFPAIVIAICRPDTKVCMIDATNKKVNFLKEVCSQLQLNADAFHFRAEEFAVTDARESFDIVVARAVANLSTLCEYTLPLCKVGGQFLAMKTNCDEEVQNANKAMAILGGRLKNISKFVLANEFERSIVCIDKIKATDKKYPRGKNLPREKPL